MKGFLLTLAVVLAGFFLQAQNKFPEDFTGKWKGKLHWTPAGVRAAGSGYGIVHFTFQRFRRSILLAIDIWQRHHR